jgi:hypothetical protein
MTEDTMPMDAVKLMVSIDFKNRCATDRMRYQIDLREINKRKLGLKELNSVADVLTIYCDKQNDMGISPTWIENSIETIEDYIEMEKDRLDKEEYDVTNRLKTLNSQVKEFEQKEKKRKKNGKRTAKKNAKKP